MSYLEALRTKRCTQCFRCCYIAAEYNQGLNLDDLDELGIIWIHVPIGDDTYNFFAVCPAAGIDDGLNPSCLIQEWKPVPCVELLLVDRVL